MTTFPVNNIRKNVDGSWNTVLKTESITVPMSPPYVVQLSEIPDNGEIQSPPSIVGFLISETYPPDPNEIYINYGNGQVAFDSSKAGNTYSIQYYAKGTLVDADHINYLYENKAEVSGVPLAGEVAVFTNYNTIEGVSEIDGGTF